MAALQSREVRAMNSRVRIAGFSIGSAIVIGVLGFLFPGSALGRLVGTIDGSYVSAALRYTVPIGFAALGGIFAEKSGVINIGLEGLLIISAFIGIAVADTMAGSAGATQTTLWLGFFAAVLASTLFALLFAIVCIEFKADQIIAGLAVWLIALGLAPFGSKIIWGRVNSPSVGTLNNWQIPLLADIPVVGPILFDANPVVYMLLAAVPLTWFVLNETAFGRWVKASGENPMALDTVGVDVRRVRYASVLLSGVLAGIGGAGLSLGQAGLFNGSGTTMVDGRGWIGITAFLFGNYNPLGAFGASFLFASLDALQIRLQQVGFQLPNELIGIIPYVTVIVVLAFVGRTRIPDAAGEHYESGEE
ncbi:nucleoside ABC transporter membrane protein [Haladaptatus litoreus]|uniref:Nucleoside ABC transporter membrane protein n=2 Tax=Haladaptatus litoreus TaxID=553468 RepID=A0A1N6XK91_9EURY|nr:nucleoside ABC transporter membrane protein [Haladaptatus litoreus]